MSTTDIDPAAASLATAVAASAMPGLPGRSGDPRLDEFARRAGPDVAIGSGQAPVKMHAIFSVDPDTNRLRVRVVDDAGRLVRMIPPDSVAEMIAAMGGYGG